MVDAAQPSARTVLLSDQTATLRGRTITAVTPSWPEKDPVDIETYAADFASIIGDRAIVQPNIAITPAGSLFVVSGGVSGTTINLTLAGGTDGVTYTLSVGALLDDGSLIVRAAMLPVVAQASVELAPADPTMFSVNGITVAVGGIAFTVGATASPTPPTFVPAYLINPQTGQPFINPLTGQPILMPGVTPASPSSAAAAQAAPLSYATNPLTGQPLLNPITGQPILMPSPVGGATQ